MKFVWGNIGAYHDNDPEKGIREKRDVVAEGPMITPAQLAISLLPMLTGVAAGLLTFGIFAFENGAKAWEAGEFKTLKDLGVVKD